MQLVPRKQETRNGGRETATYAIDPLRSEMDRMFERFFGDAWSVAAPELAHALVPVDVSETDEHVILRIELPGVDPKQVELSVEKGVLTVAGEKRAEAVGADEALHVRERRFGAFRRTFTLPPSIDEQQIRAQHEHGVLTIELKKLAAAKPRKIDIKTA